MADKKETSLRKKSPPKKNIYQMQRAVDFSRIKPQNSWRIFKKLTIRFVISTVSPCPFSRADFLKELAPRVFEEMKENLSDLSMKVQKTPIPFFHVLKLANSLEIEVRYLLTEDNISAFSWDSRDYNAILSVFDSEDAVLSLKNPRNPPQMLVFLTRNPLEIQEFQQKHAFLQENMYVFDLNSQKSSFEALRVFVDSRILAIHEERVRKQEKKQQIFANFEKNLKPRELEVINFKEIALKLAFVKQNAEKTRFFKDLALKLGQPPELLFANFRKKLETLAMKFQKEVLDCRPCVSKEIRGNFSTISKVSASFQQKFSLSPSERRDFAYFCLENLTFNAKKWKRNLYVLLGRPSEETVWRELFKEIDEEMLVLKPKFQKTFENCYISAGNPRVCAPKSHLSYASRGLALKKTQVFCETLGNYFLKHKFWAEISKETMKIFLGNPEAGVKIPQEISQLKQLTLTLQANLQKINDERTSLAYLQQDFNPLENKARVISENLEKFERKRRSFAKIAVIFCENCEKSRNSLRNCPQTFRISGESEVFKVFPCVVEENSAGFSEIKARILKEKPSKIVFLLTKNAWESMDKLFTELINEEISLKNATIVSFKETKAENSIIESYMQNLRFSWIELENFVGFIEIFKLLRERENPLETNLKRKLGDFYEERQRNAGALTNYSNFFEFLKGNGGNSHEELSEKLVSELFSAYFAVKDAKNQRIEEVLKTLLAGVKNLENTIENREKKALDLRLKLNELEEKQENLLKTGINPDYLAIKLERIESNAREIEQKLKKVTFGLIYGKNKTNFKHFPGFSLKEKFLFPLETSTNFVEVLIKAENQSLLEVFKVNLQGNPLQKTDSSLTKLTKLETKMKFLNLEEETLKINVKNLKKLLYSNKTFLESLYEFKYNFLANLNKKVAEINENASVSFDSQDFQRKTDKKLAEINEQILSHEQLLEKLRENSQKFSEERKTLEENAAKHGESQEKPGETQEKTETLLKIIQRKEEQIQQQISVISSKLEEKRDFLTNFTSGVSRTAEIKQKITDFFTNAVNADLSPSDLLKLRDYFLYFQKSVLKFYIKSSLIEADLFEMKKDAKKALLKSGLSMLAGSVPFIGDILKTVVEKGIELKEKYDEMKLARNCTKFCVLVHSSEILSEILEETALSLIQSKEKQRLILAVEGFKDSFWEKLKKKVAEFLRKAKEKLLKSAKKEEKLLKDIDTPAKLLASVDASYVCAHAAGTIENDSGDFNVFDAKDPYQKKPLIALFAKLASDVKENVYEKVLSFNEENREIVLENEGKSLKELDSEIAGFSLKTPQNCAEEIKKIHLDEEETEKISKVNEENAEALSKNQVSLEEIKEKEREIELQIEKLLKGKAAYQVLLRGHEEKLNYLEHNFDKVENGAKAGTLLVKDLKNDATYVEFDLNERTKALTRKSEAIHETIVLLDKYKEVLLKRKAWK